VVVAVFIFSFFVFGFFSAMLWFSYPERTARGKRFFWITLRDVLQLFAVGLRTVL
jgi:hypothetical protein